MIANRLALLLLGSQASAANLVTNSASSTPCLPRARPVANFIVNDGAYETTALGTPNGLPPFSLLDGVTATAVPEAGTWAMFIAGFGLVWLSVAGPPPPPDPYGNGKAGPCAMFCCVWDKAVRFTLGQRSIGSWRFAG